MASLSVIMIVKNETACLAACLKSVAPIADEIIVGDTGSEDDTVAIAEGFGARVISVPWTNDFSAARNETIRAATSDWLLHMDADEELDAEGAAAIREIVDSDTTADAVELILANYCNDVHAWRWTPVDPASSMSRGFAGCLPVGLLRLFRGDRGFIYQEAVHENITASVRERNGVVRQTDIVIHHYGYACTPEIRARKAKLYLKLAREKHLHHPKDLKCLHDVAEQAMACGETDEAESACRDALAIDPMHMEIGTLLSTILLGRNAVDEACQLLLEIEKNIGETPDHVQIVLGVIACYRGNWEEAEERLMRVVQAAPPAPLATLCLARVFDYRSDGKRAHRLLRDLAAAAPHLEEAQARLQSHELRQAGEAAFVGGAAETGLKSLVKALELDAEDAVTHNDLGVLMHTLGDVVRARESFERALKLAPALKDARENLARLVVRGG